MAGGIRLRIEAGLFSLPGRSLLRDEVFLQPSIMANVYWMIVVGENVSLSQLDDASKLSTNNRPPRHLAIEF